MTDGKVGGILDGKSGGYLVSRPARQPWIRRSLESIRRILFLRYCRDVSWMAIDSFTTVHTYAMWPDLNIHIAQQIVRRPAWTLMLERKTGC